MPNPWRGMPVHRLFVFTEHGMEPGLVAGFLEKAGEAGCRIVVDPFVGSGTVMVEAQKAGFDGIGIDANPWALVVSAAKTRSPGPGLVNRVVGLLEEGVEPLVPSGRLYSYHPSSVVRRLGVLRAAIGRLEPRSRALALTVFGRIAEEFSRFRRSPAPRFDRRVSEGDPVEAYLEALASAVSDLGMHRFGGTVDLFWADSTEWLPRRVCCALTSPPFANNIDYIRHTQLQLLWAGFARDSLGLGRLRDLQVPASEAASRAWKPVLDDEEVRRIVSKVGGSRARGYRRFLGQYFYQMDRHLELLSQVLEWEAWYTVGDSYLGGAYVPTHVVLARLASKHGLETEVRWVGERRGPGRRLGLYLLRFRARR